MFSLAKLERRGLLALANGRERYRHRFTKKTYLSRTARSTSFGVPLLEKATFVEVVVVEAV